jgi:UMF1 family MFS transporter
LAAAGAFAFGYAQDRVGHKQALAWTLAGWIVMVAIAALERPMLARMRAEERP